MKRILLLLTFISIFFSAEAQWQALGSGLNGRVRAIAVFNNEIYAGGTFTTPSHIAKWNGSAWVAVGGGLNDSINSLVVHNGKLYAGGNFTADGGGAQVKYVAGLNTSTNQWESVGGGLNNFVRAVYSDGTYLYAGGAFNNSGTPAVSRIAKFDGTSWSQVGDIPTGIVDCITRFNGSIYIGGAFSSWAAKLNGTTWQGLSGLNFEVLALCPFGSTLYLGGKFTSPWPHLATTTGTTTGSAFNSLDNNVNALYATPSAVFGGGAFIQSPSASISLPHFFVYNGNSPFSTVGGGTNGDIYAISNLGGKIIIGGSFTTAGSTSAANIAMSSQTIGIDELSSIVESSTFYPNPVADHSVVNLVTNEPVHNPTLKIMDSQSRMIREIRVDEVPGRNEYHFAIFREGLASGLYYYQVSDQDGRRITSNKFVVE